MGFDRPNRPIIRPNGSARQTSSPDVHVTDCKICDEMIKTSEPRVWARNIEPSRRTGLVHVVCAETADCETVGDITSGGQHKYRT